MIYAGFKIRIPILMANSLGVQFYPYKFLEFDIKLGDWSNVRIFRGLSLLLEDSRKKDIENVTLTSRSCSENQNRLKIRSHHFFGVDNSILVKL